MGVLRDGVHIGHGGLAQKGRSMTGEELATIRKAAGLSQTDLAQRAGIGRHAVSYWELKPRIDHWAYAVRAIAGVLTLPDIPLVKGARTGWAERLVAIEAAQEATILAHMAQMQAALDEVAAKCRMQCGAKTRKGMPCRGKSEPGKRRCKFHGGMSTGARTTEGKARIAEAQRRRWARWRAEREGAG